MTRMAGVRKIDDRLVLPGANHALHHCPKETQAHAMASAHSTRFGVDYWFETILKYQRFHQE